MVKGCRSDACSGAVCLFVISIVLQASEVPPIGSNAAATFWLPPAEVKVFAASESKTTPSSWIASQLGALKGPPSGVLDGQVCVKAVTRPAPGIAGVSSGER